MQANLSFKILESEISIVWLFILPSANLLYRELTGRLLSWKDLADLLAKTSILAVVYPICCQIIFAIYFTLLLMCGIALSLVVYVVDTYYDQSSERIRFGPYWQAYFALRNARPMRISNARDIGFTYLLLAIFFLIFFFGRSI